MFGGLWFAGLWMNGLWWGGTGGAGPVTDDGRPQQSTMLNLLGRRGILRGRLVPVRR